MFISDSTAPDMEQCVLWLRYIDDLFLIWEGSEQPAKTFAGQLNDNALNLKFTCKISNKSTEFLDVLVEIPEGKMNNSLYRKPRAGNTLTHALSSHLESSRDTQVEHTGR